VTSGSLPTGLSLSSGGVLSGTPTVAGYKTFTITATDSLSATGSQSYTLYVAGLLYWFICTSAAYPSAVPVVAGSQVQFNRRAANAIAGLNKTRRDVGDFIPRPVSTPVDNALLCDGSAVSRIAFPALFALIGTTWGAGDGSTTFNIPNLLGSVIPNATTAPTQTVGDTTVSNSSTTITEPTTTTESGGEKGGNIVSGGRFRLNNSY
jgi:hypothetical protein